MSKRFGGQAAGSKAKRQWICDFCSTIYAGKIKICERCGASSITYFQSKAELKRWLELVTLRDAGVIEGLARQVVFEFQDGGAGVFTPEGRVMKHVVDFSYVENGEMVYEDSKGVDTDLGYLKRELVRFFYGHEIKLT